ncbi:MAG: hypothetical protein GY754_01200 [bacterium]|nr:hypothetical protein [bacterium]
MEEMEEKKTHEDIHHLYKLIKAKIPIIEKMGFSPSFYDGTTIRIQAPLDLNKNDKDTGFAGSLYSLAVVTGWSFAYLKLRESNIDADIAIYKGEVTYHKPVTDDFESCCLAPAEEELNIFREELRSNGKARIQLSIKLIQGGEEKLTFDGIYAAWLKKT